MDIATWNSEHKDTIRQQTNKNKKRYEQHRPHQKTWVNSGDRER